VEITGVPDDLFLNGRKLPPEYFSQEFAKQVKKKNVELNMFSIHNVISSNLLLVKSAAYWKTMWLHLYSSWEDHFKILNHNSNIGT
jgi:hypothetical protein